MMGMNASTGRSIAGADHLSQSVADILGTPIGTRVGRRWYGSQIPELLDQPLNGLTRQRVLAAGALALQRQEPRLRAATITLDFGRSDAVLTIGGTRRDGPRPASATFSIPVRARSALA